VLIVDDHDAFRRSARSVLEADGFDVVGEAENGVAALRAARELDPDVVLLDINLPDFDGFEVAERLRRNGAGAAIVLTSSREGADYGSLIADSAARGFIPKDRLSGGALREVLA
jgi:DNA-binding NarL/FixJ family response regulator